MSPAMNASGTLTTNVYTMKRKNILLGLLW